MAAAFEMILADMKSGETKIHKESDLWDDGGDKSLFISPEAGPWWQMVGETWQLIYLECVLELFYHMKCWTVLQHCSGIRFTKQFHMTKLSNLFLKCYSYSKGFSSQVKNVIKRCILHINLLKNTCLNFLQRRWINFCDISLW